MTTDVDWQTVQDLFETLADESPSYRAQYLSMACDDKETKTAILKLLATHDRANGKNTVEPSNIDPRFKRGDRHLNFRIETRLGRGGLSEVYLATELKRQTLYAIKILKPLNADEDDAVIRFAHEGKLLSRLRHANLCNFYRIIDDTKAPCLVMEYCEGKQLTAWLDDGTLSLPTTLGLIREITQGLMALHMLKIFHRDLKPNNIIITPDRQVKIVDLGIAKESTVESFKTGMFQGTPWYIAPEQWLGQGVDQRTDLWAIGVIWYQALSGKKPFENDDPTLLVKQVTTKTPKPIELPEPYEAYSVLVNKIINKLLAKNKEARFKNIEELNNAIRYLKNQMV